MLLRERNASSTDSMLFGSRPSYWPTGGAGRLAGRLPAGTGTGVASGVVDDPGTGAVVTGATPGVGGSGEFRGALVGGLGFGRGGRGGGGGDDPTWANSSLNTHTPVCPGETPVQTAFPERSRRSRHPSPCSCR